MPPRCRRVRERPSPLPRKGVGEHRAARCQLGYRLADELTFTVADDRVATGRLDDLCQVLGHPVRTNWNAATKRLAEHDDVGLQSPGPGESSEVLHLGVRLVENEQRAGPPGERS